MKLTFIDELAEKPRAALIYRPYTRSAQSLEDAAYVERHRPGISILSGSLQDAMLRCRLLVLDHPGTTLHEALAANVPTVAYWDPAAWPLCPEAVPLFDGLRRCGMLFDDPAAAAQRINEIWPDVPGWWTSMPVQQARRAWTQKHARTSPVWWWHWARALWKFSTAPGPALESCNRPRPLAN